MLLPFILSRKRLDQKFKAAKERICPIYITEHLEERWIFKTYEPLNIIESIPIIPITRKSMLNFSFKIAVCQWKQKVLKCLLQEFHWTLAKNYFFFIIKQKRKQLLRTLFPEPQEHSSYHSNKVPEIIINFTKQDARAIRKKREHKNSTLSSSVQKGSIHKKLDKMITYGLLGMH